MTDVRTTVIYTAVIGCHLFGNNLERMQSYSSVHFTYQWRLWRFTVKLSIHSKEANISRSVTSTTEYYINNS